MCLGRGGVAGVHLCDYCLSSLLEKNALSNGFTPWESLLLSLYVHDKQLWTLSGRSVNLPILLLGRLGPPMQFTSTKCPFVLQ